MNVQFTHFGSLLPFEVCLYAWAALLLVDKKNTVKKTKSFGEGEVLMASNAFSAVVWLPVIDFGDDSDNCCHGCD